SSALPAAEQMKRSRRRGAAIEQLQALIPDASKDIACLVVANYRDYRTYTVKWSAAYFGSVFGSAFLSALAAVLLKLDLLAAHQPLRNDLAAIFAAAAALLVTFYTVGDFQKKWRANRMAATAMENLAYEFLKDPQSVNRSVVIAKIQEINTARNEAIVGEHHQGPGAATDQADEWLDLRPYTRRDNKLQNAE